jgi:hypothetical protein
MTCFTTPDGAPKNINKDVDKSLAPDENKGILTVASKFIF